MRTIDADALERDGWQMSRTVQIDKNTMEFQTRKPTDFPAIEPQRMRGKWIWKGEEGDSRFSCSVCKCREHVPTCNGIPDIWEFCPNCGADMRETE